MYSKSESITNNIEDINNYFKGYDVYNSTLFNVLTDPNINREEYRITIYEYRPDLIAEDYYGSVDYLGILLIQTKLSLSEFTKGNTINLIPKKVIDAILNKL